MFLRLMSKSVLPMVPSRPCLASAFMLQKWIWCELVVVGGITKESSVMLVHGAVQFPQHSLHRLSFPHWTFSPPLSETNGHHKHEFLSGCSVLFHGTMWKCGVKIPYCLDDVSFAG